MYVMNKDKNKISNIINRISEQGSKTKGDAMNWPVHLPLAQNASDARINARRNLTIA